MRNNYYSIFITFFVLLLSLTNTVDAKSAVSVADGYVKASIPGSNITAAYMTISNDNDTAISLEKITSRISDAIEIHQHSMVDGMMSMRQVDYISIDANSKVVLQPSGLHLMIFALKEQIIEKDVIPLTLYFSNNTELNIQLPVYRYK